MLKCRSIYSDSQDSKHPLCIHHTVSHKKLLDVFLIISDCGDPSPTLGSANDTAYIYGTVLAITCNTGHSRTGEAVITCQEDGTWTDTPTCAPDGTYTLHLI